MSNGQSACDESFTSAVQCQEACLAGGWDWCEWDTDGECVWDGEQWICPNPDEIFVCSGCFGCCEKRNSPIIQDDCVNFMNVAECRDSCIMEGYAWCRWTPFVNCDGDLCDGPFARIFYCNTVTAGMACTPPSGTIPFNEQFELTLSNNTGFVRTIAAHIDVTLAGGGYFPNWRAGYTNVSAGDSYIISWNQNIPSIGSVVGDNFFQLLAEDVTPAPYNQPPYPPAGDTNTVSCTVTGMAPELFDYGPPYENWEAETIGLEMLGADGELLLPEETYNRIDRDLDLIRTFEFALADQMHTPAWALNQLIIQKVPSEPSAEYDALNTYFQMTEEEHLFGDWYVLTFAGNSNIPALAQLYLELAAVEYAEPNGIIGGENYWSPTELLGDTWNWDIDDGWHDCFDGCDCHRHYIFEVDAGGAVTLTYYEEWGYPYCEF